MKKLKKQYKAFTLIEMLITISIIGILVTLSSFALNQARQSGRDAQRKSDLSQIRSALEMYRSDALQYPDSLPSPGSPLSYGGSTYLDAMPDDPTTGQDYLYAKLSNFQYELCASLEGGSGSVACGGSSNCGSATCNYQVKNP